MLSAQILAVPPHSVPPETSDRDKQYKRNERMKTGGVEVPCGSLIESQSLFCHGEVEVDDRGAEWITRPLAGPRMTPRPLPSPEPERGPMTPPGLLHVTLTLSKYFIDISLDTS